jgi:predicted RNase H-like HicB family nuclease
MLYPIAIEPPANANECYGIEVPDIAGCFSAADDLDDAVANAQQAIALHLESLADDGDPIPMPKAISEHLSNPEYAGRVWLLVDVDVSRYMGRAEKINVTLPSRLIHLIDDRVAKDHRFKSRSAFLAAGAEKLLQA